MIFWFRQLKDDEIKYMKNNLNKQINNIDNISKNLKDLIENASEDKEIVIDELSNSYKDLIRDKELYTFNIEKDVESRIAQARNIQSIALKF